MKFIPHPAALAAISAATGRRLQASDHDDAGRRRSRSSLPQPYTAHGVAAYAWPNDRADISYDRIGVAYDMYNAQYPEGAVPGLANIHYAVQHHPNDTSSYAPRILSFKSVPDLEMEGLRLDQTAAGLILRDDRAALVITQDEMGMREVQDRLVEGAKLIRAPIRHVDIDAGGLMMSFVSTYTTGGGLEIYAATSDHALHEALSERYGFILKGENLSEFKENLHQHADQRGWVVCESDPDTSWIEAEKHIEVTTPEGLQF